MHQKIDALSCVWRKIVFLYVKSIDFSMKIDPKIVWEPCQKLYNFYFMLQMYSLMLVSFYVSGVLQIQKTTKFCITVLIFHYNRDLNTNGRFAAALHFVYIATKNVLCRKINLLKPLLRVIQIPASSIWTCPALCMVPELMPQA